MFWHLVIAYAIGVLGGLISGYWMGAYTTYVKLSLERDFWAHKWAETMTELKRYKLPVKNLIEEGESDDS